MGRTRTLIGVATVNGVAAGMPCAVALSAFSASA